ISHIPPILAVRVITKSVSDEERTDTVLERQPVGQLPLDERARRQDPAEVDRRLVILVAPMDGPVAELAAVPEYRQRHGGGRDRGSPPHREQPRDPGPGGQEPG